MVTKLIVGSIVSCLNFINDEKQMKMMENMQNRTQKEKKTDTINVLPWGHYPDESNPTWE